MASVLHLLSGLAIGGKERAALRIARRAVEQGERHHLVLFDTPFRSEDLDFAPHPVVAEYLPRGTGLDLSFARRLARKMRESGAEVVHAHNDTALVYAALAKMLRPGRGARIVATYHSWPSHPTRGARLAARAAATQARVVAVSDELATRLRNTGWLRACGTVWNGVDLLHFTPSGPDGGWRETLGVAPSGVLVGHVARFDPIKRHEDVVQAARVLAVMAPEVTIAFVGRGSTRQGIERQAAGLPNVRFISHVTDMAPLLRSLDMLLLCSAHEAAPLSLLEAMACGVPVVATSVGGIPHMVGSPGPAQAGVLTPPLDPARLAEAIASLARNPAERARLAAGARHRAGLFSFDAEWSAYQALYAGASSPG